MNFVRRVTGAGNFLRRLAGAVVLATVLAAAPPAAAQFVPGIADLPMMDGLGGDSEGPVVFDTPHGRIVVATASGGLDKKSVHAFYAATLPQLGWQRLSEGNFRREDESLKLVISALPGGRIRVRFRLAPVPARAP
ncbi:MAG: hypothetical protein QGH73_16735 [Rhodospirillales bacterium]|jgi:hypothetical protein|nr:hypothetical protein [Rhodospirillaceae bacterium]MDP6427501.1 hypothetical protein [Rhodospirillales bacterium]MDP6646261.1 hypothetical protein [Rhodospirillales bacterium]MDP6843318.1 hypothetical protein [Rhodospirillales bacterium]